MTRMLAKIHQLHVCQNKPNNTIIGFLGNVSMPT